MATEAISILKKHSSSKKAYQKVLRHSRAVRRLALTIAKGTRADINLISTAALLHDIGRFKFPPWSEQGGVRHGEAGELILRKEGLPRHAKIAASHVGSGITKEEAKKLGMKAKSYMPKTIEEKIICYADSLVFFDIVKDYRAVAQRYGKEVGPALVKRTIKLRNYLRKISPYLKKNPEL